MVGDGHAMGVAAQVLQHIGGTTKGRLQVHYPLFSKQWSQPSGEDVGLCQELQVGLEDELAIPESLFERVDELAAKNFLQHFLGKKVVVS